MVFWVYLGITARNNYVPFNKVKILRVTSPALGSNDLSLDQSGMSIQILPEPNAVTWHVFFNKITTLFEDNKNLAHYSTLFWTLLSSVKLQVAFSEYLKFNFFSDFIIAENMISYHFISCQFRFSIITF